LPAPILTTPPGGALEERLVTVADLARSIGGISSDAVQARTGKTWDEWLHALDRAGARQLNHKAIVALVARRSSAGPWWQRMVAVGYEQARGLGGRRRPSSSGLQVSASRTIPPPPRVLFLHWADARRRKMWLPHQALTITSRTAGRAIRGAWGAGRERLDVAFSAKPGGKTQVTVNHRQLPTQAAARRAQSFWRARLTMLARTVRAAS
jgi:hypothetical protein